MQPVIVIAFMSIFGENRPSIIKPEMHHIAILDDVFFAFEAHFAGFLGALFAAKGDIIVVRYRLGPDEAVFEVSVDDAGGLGRRGAAFDCPGAGFLGACGEIGL